MTRVAFSDLGKWEPLWRGVPHHVSSSAAQIWFQGMAEGRGDDDYTSLIQVVEKWAGVEVDGKAARGGK